MKVSPYLRAGISGGLAPREDAEQMPTMFITVESIEDYMRARLKSLAQKS